MRGPRVGVLTKVTPPMEGKKAVGPSPTHCTLVADMHGSLSVQHRAVVGGNSNNGRRRVVILRSPHGPFGLIPFARRWAKEQNTTKVS